MNFRLESGLRSISRQAAAGRRCCAIIKDRNTPGALAAELASAKEKRDQKVFAAEETFATKRVDVIQRGVARVRELRALREEALREEEALQDQVTGTVE